MLTQWKAEEQCPKVSGRRLGLGLGPGLGPVCVRLRKSAGQVPPSIHHHRTDVKAIGLQFSGATGL